MSWYGNAFRSIGAFGVESTGHRWIPLNKGKLCADLTFLLLLAWKRYRKNCHCNEKDGSCLEVGGKGTMLLIIRASFSSFLGEITWKLSQFLTSSLLTQWGRVTHICVGNITIIGLDNGLSPGRHQAIIWTNAGILLIGPLGTNVSEILNEIHTFSFKKMHLKTSPVKRRPFCLGLNVFSLLTVQYYLFGGVVHTCLKTPTYIHV